ncbi:hypothetical protein D3C81_2101200 [compost metagenome]
MITCWIPSNMLRCGPSRNVAKSLAMTLAEASDSQAWANRLSVSMFGTMVNIVLGLWGASFLRMAGLRWRPDARWVVSASDSGGLGVGLTMTKLLD